MSARNAMHRGRLLVVLLLVFGGCARESRKAPERARPCEEADAKLVDQVLLAWLSKA